MDKDVVRFVRNSKNLSQSAFARKIGVSHSYVNRIEGGERRLTEGFAQRVRGVFDITDERLVAIKLLISAIK